jgi:hypothetical protein
MIETLLTTTLLLASPVFVVEKAVEPKVCMIYKDTKYTCSQLMLLYNKHAYRTENKGI